MNANSQIFYSLKRVVFGEDTPFIAFRTTSILVEKFGRDRILYIPLREESIADFGVGMPFVIILQLQKFNLLIISF